MKSHGAGRRRAALLGVVAAAGLAVYLIPLATSDAASPSSSSVSSTHPAVTWTGALKLATAGGCSGPKDSTCDNYKLAAGSSNRASVICDTTGQNGQHTIAATADPNHAIAESNENNNTGSRTVTVSGGKVN